jgi:tetratricopeptide (TPR) repeat protein
MLLRANAQEEGGRGYYDLGVFAYEDGDYQNAESYLKKALEFNPDDPYYNHYIGKTYLKIEDYKAAEQYLSRAWELDSDISGLKYDRAMLNYKTSRYSVATDLFTEIVDEDPSNVLVNIMPVLVS